MLSGGSGLLGSSNHFVTNFHFGALGSIGSPMGHGMIILFCFLLFYSICRHPSVSKREKRTWEAHSLMKHTTNTHFKCYVKQGLAWLGEAENLATQIWKNSPYQKKLESDLDTTDYSFGAWSFVSSRLFQKQRLSKRVTKEFLWTWVVNFLIPKNLICLA